MPNDALRFAGRILFLTEDATLLRQQLDGTPLSREVVNEIIAGGGPKLVDNISTDEITPGWVCYYYDETLGEYCAHRPARPGNQRGRHQEGWLRRHRQRTEQGLRQLARDRLPTARWQRAFASSSPAASRRSTGRTARTSASSPRPTSPCSGASSGRGAPARRVHRGPRPHQRGHRAIGRPVLLQQEAAGRRDRAAGHHHRGAADDRGGEDHRGARGGRRQDRSARRARGASRAMRSSCAPTCASATST
jgi:hypothetical protein